MLATARSTDSHENGSLKHSPFKTSKIEPPKFSRSHRFNKSTDASFGNHKLN